MKKLLTLLFILFSFVISAQDIIPTRVNFQQLHIIKIQPNIIKLDSIYIDTILFYNSLREKNLYQDFKNSNYHKIDINLFKECLRKSKIDHQQTNFVKSEKNSNELNIEEKVIYSQPNNKINNDIKNTILYSQSQEVSGPEEKPKVVNRSPSSIEPSPVIDQQPKATLTYVIKDTMKIGETYTIDLTLSSQMSKNQLIRIIDGFKNKELIDTMITITPVMRARLLDPGKCFDQEPITDLIQSTVGKNLIRWQWQVIPKVEGEISLTISVDNYIGNVPQNVNIYNGKTYVYAKHSPIGDLWKKIKENWTYITWTLTGIFAIFAWLYKEKIINVFKRRE